MATFIKPILEEQSFVLEGREFKNNKAVNLDNVNYIDTGDERHHGSDCLSLMFNFDSEVVKWFYRDKKSMESELDAILKDFGPE